MPKLTPSTVYEVSSEDSVLVKGTRVEFIDGPDGDMFTDGNVIEYLGDQEVSRSPDQTPIELTREMSIARSYALSGIDPT